ncbi:natural killer cell receptor 2B4-like [Myxocyprinus asiaticus]|uniref:natural killer cell receptor 2B4-like n=1 Tax=Myxocyprinus asiaticus TaxID=70543 RepID=UPI0022223DDB|nr:natural killer cell receptor 2B4-like [Myxocyprinus asiaticus]
MMRNNINRTTFFSLFMLVINGVFVADRDGVKSVSVMEGDSVTLHTDLTEIQRDDQILWQFGPQETRILTIFNQMISTYNSHERFGDRLQLDRQTGSLAIRNIRIIDSGHFKLTILSDTGNSEKRFEVTVYAPLLTPVMTRDCPQKHSAPQRSSSPKCVLQCSVMNVTHCGNVTLSWYKGNSLFSSISVSDLNSSLSLPLEVEYQENNTYSCVISNHISNQTKHLNITEVCQTCPDSSPIHHKMVFAACIPAVLLAVLVCVMYILNRKHRRSGQKDSFDASLHVVETVEMEMEDVLYTETTFCKKGPKKKPSGIEETIYASVVT